jgi:4-diphosphocytidyl-2-C-methyl-D-erythritol kinase
MIIRRDGTSVVVSTPAKVNLHLEVLRRRPDEYHDLETLMVAVGLYDTLEFKDDSTGDVRLTCDRPDLSTGPDNLVWRAAELLQRQASGKPGATIRLWKRIPVAAGLAGGSSDAAATLAGLNLLWRLGLPRAELSRLGAELGSDVSFFFAAPAAWCTGRGEVIRPLRLGCPLDFVLACPSAGLSTAEVFRKLTIPERPVPGDEICRAVEGGDVAEIGRRLHNRLQPVAERLCPGVGILRDRLAALNPAGVLMSGSGSTVFALCRDAGEALRVSRGVVGSRKSEARSQRGSTGDRPDVGTLTADLWDGDWPRIHSVRSSP